MSKRVADVLIETLEAAGVKRCYGIVGDTLNRIAHAKCRCTRRCRAGSARTSPEQSLKPRASCPGRSGHQARRSRSESAPKGASIDRAYIPATSQFG
jgi:hypothetical protein